MFNPMAGIRDTAKYSPTPLRITPSTTFLNDNSWIIITVHLTPRTVTLTYEIPSNDVYASDNN